jgi:hypothetical protein
MCARLHVASVGVRACVCMRVRGVRYVCMRACACARVRMRVCTHVHVYTCACVGVLLGVGV